MELKFDQTAFRLSQERSDFLLPQILDFVRSRRWVNLRPEYQRRLVWDDKKRSLFIESLLLNVPIPQLFLYESDLSRYEVMDGQQRLNAVVDFYEGAYSLTGLDRWSELNGLSFDELPQMLQRGLDRRRLSATILLLERTTEAPPPPDDIRKLVFERLNTGGQQLNAQELRNCLWAGPFNDALIRVASHPDFTRAWEIPEHSTSLDKSGRVKAPLAKNKLYSRMGDCEIALRYFAFARRDKLSGSVRDMLDSCMRDYSTLGLADATRLENDFLARLDVAQTIFGTHVFRYRNKKGRWLLSRPLFDGVLVALDTVWSKRTILVKRKERVRKALADLLHDPEAYAVLVGKPNTAKAVKQRVDLLASLFRSAAK
jgi:hypothetical protein